MPTQDLSRLAATFDTLLANAPLGIGVFDRDCRHVRVNAVLAQMNGRDADELIGRTPAEVNGEVGEQAETLYRQVMAGGEPMRGVRLSGEVSARPGDRRHWDLAFHPIRLPRARAPEGQELPGDGEVVGLCVVVDDVTVETELAAQVQRSSARIEHITESMVVGYLAMDADWRVTHVNAHAVAALGRSREALVGRTIWELFPETVGTAFEEGYRRARDSARPVSFDAYYPPPLDAWYEVRATPEGDGVALYFTDITVRVRAQRDAQVALRRAELLAEAGELFAGVADAEEALAALAGLLVPAVADWAVVTVVEGAVDDPDGAHDPRRRKATSVLDETADRVRAAARLQRMHDVAVAHRDPARVGDVERYAAARLDAYRSSPVPTVSPYMARALLDGAPSVIASGATAAVRDTFPTHPPHPAVHALEALAPESALMVPVVARGRTLGMVSLCWDAAPAHRADASGASVAAGARLGASPVEELGVDPVDTRTALGASGPTPEVVSLVRAVADRAGIVVDAVAAAQQQVRIAEQLQRALLTAPPEPDHAHVVVRYVPAAAAAQVGGDWYDAFLQPPGATVLVIGDVLGHDTDAAAAMGQVRTLVRAAAVMTGEGPAGVLRATDRAVRALEVGPTVTAVVLRLEQDAEQVERRVTTLRWSNAGHPPPVLLDEDGGARFLHAPDAGADLLLGVDPDVDRGEHTAEVPRGSTVLLYTDGLVERRREGLDAGLERLRATVAAVARAQAAGDVADGLDALCDEVLARMLPERGRDDVALVAVRLHHQDRPRPLQAGAVDLPSWASAEPDVPLVDGRP
ncbi:SpoIIE family protein phosphatase [Aquipuribacter sp. SD81]|uniref:SpoIIE family protein phosphatase n=1 Tax=Aquipuribacter sp. SD81 TaxID=3127703 RepID=UPI003019B390